MVTNHLFESKTHAKLIDALKGYPGAELTDLRFEQSRKGEIVTAEIRANQPLGSDKVAALESLLPN